jgi:hypothetical protein
VDSNDLAMMYRATYVPDFYRTLHALTHAEFRSRRRFAGRSARQAAAAFYHAARVPLLRRRLARLGRQKSTVPAVVIQPVLTPQAAAVPTEQR